MYSRNLTTGEEVNCALDNRHRGFAEGAWSITMDDGNYLYYAANGVIHRLGLTEQGGTYCPVGDVYVYPPSEYNGAEEIDIDPQDEGIMYNLSDTNSSIQKLEFSADRIILQKALLLEDQKKIRQLHLLLLIPTKVIQLHCISHMQCMLEMIEYGPVEKKYLSKSST
tara:strand:- start:20 stop:520 length:501 start_codon:yes stop_codon:yes gene_type:complete